jgi:NAD(P)-dependent dehydrogenase (short-subunit alcohol dehydrogenase family)
MSSVVITGASRGIGLEFTRQFATSGYMYVFAACRDPSTATQLAQLATTHPSIHIVQLNVEDDQSIHAAAQHVQTVLGGAGLTVLINNAGVLYRDNILTETRDRLMQTLQVNVAGPMVVTQAFYPLLKMSDASLVVNISSNLGSMALVRPGNTASYRVSKCALNMMTKLVMLEGKEEGVRAVSLSPGWTDTDMGRSGGSVPPLSTVDSVRGMLALVHRALQEEGMNGEHYEYDGRQIPW